MAVSQPIAAFFNVFGVSATWRPPDYADEETALVIFDAPGELVLNGVAQSVAYAITYPSTVFVGMAEGDPIEVDGANYVVRTQPIAEPGTDGKTMIAVLSHDEEE